MAPTTAQRRRNSMESAMTSSREPTKMMLSMQISQRALRCLKSSSRRVMAEPTPTDWRWPTAMHVSA